MPAPRERRRQLGLEDRQPVLVGRGGATGSGHGSIRASRASRVLGPPAGHRRDRTRHGRGGPVRPPSIAPLSRAPAWPATGRAVGLPATRRRRRRRSARDDELDDGAGRDASPGGGCRADARSRLGTVGSVDLLGRAHAQAAVVRVTTACAGVSPATSGTVTRSRSGRDRRRDGPAGRDDRSRVPGDWAVMVPSGRAVVPM